MEADREGARVEGPGRSVNRPSRGASDASQAQRDYYAATASEYNRAHGDSREHELALRFVAGFVEELRPRSLLDTGCGTGRGLKFFTHRFPELRVRGNDPSEELLAQSGLDESVLDCCGSEQLPYRDGEFDFVVESGMLHHVEDPRAVVGEMLRVARMAVFLSDTNIYGRGAGRAKYVLARLRLLEVVNRARRGGKRWYYSDGDGVAYSYSVYDSYGQIAAACKRTLVIPLDGGGRSPLFGSPHVLLCGFKR